MDASGTTNRKYIVDTVGDLPVILLELNPNDSNAVKKTYVYANDQIIMQHNGPATTAAKYFYLPDRLGSIRMVIDLNAAVHSFYGYEPFGRTYDAEDDDDPSVPNPFKFTGQFYDATLGQTHLRARQYQPEMLRFTAYDPIRGNLDEPLTLAPYLYCLNDPLNRTDPAGEFGFGDLLSGIGWGMRIYNAADTAWSVYGYAQQIAQGVSFRNVLLSAAVDVACQVGTNQGLKLLGKITPVINEVGQKVGKKAKSAFERHHLWPKFLGGLEKGVKRKIDTTIHEELHRRLYTSWRRSLDITRQSSVGPSTNSGEMWSGHKSWRILLSV